MDQASQLRELIATLLMVPVNEVGPETSLASLDTSLGGARVALGVKRLGLSLPRGPSAATFEELSAAISGTSIALEGQQEESKAEELPLSNAYPSADGVHVGIDVEGIASLPIATDYWAHEFYVGSFGNLELAYAAVRSEPRVHFAGFWCAKEALRKCDPFFINVGFDSTVVGHHADGRPYLIYRGPTGETRLPHALSLSHTSEIATAIVVHGLPTQSRPPTNGVMPLAGTPAPPRPSSPPTKGVMPLAGTPATPRFSSPLLQGLVALVSVWAAYWLVRAYVVG